MRPDGPFTAAAGTRSANEAPAELASETFDALPDEPNSLPETRGRNAGMSNEVLAPIAIAEVSTTVDPANAHDSVTSISRTTDIAHDGFLHLFPDHSNDAT